MVLHGVVWLQLLKSGLPTLTQCLCWRWLRVVHATLGNKSRSEISMEYRRSMDVDGKPPRNSSAFGPRNRELLESTTTT